MSPSSQKTLNNGKHEDEEEENQQQHQQHQQQQNNKYLKPACIYFEDDFLMLPSNASSSAIHEHLSFHPLLRRNAIAALKSQSVETFHREMFHNTDAPVPVIYVHQGEIGHATSYQYNQRGAVLVSDAATTCHVLAFRSFRSIIHTVHARTRNEHNAADGKNKNEYRIYGSLCHLDSPEYESCIRNTVQDHMNYHQEDKIENLDNSTSTSTSTAMPTSPICIEVHLVGGYNDAKGASSEITNAFFTLLKKLASELTPHVVFHLKTCVVCGLNDSINYRIDTSNSKSNSNSNSNSNCASSLSSPIMRGFAMDVNSGRIVLIKNVDGTLLGPKPTLRRARLWCNDSREKCLNIVHHSDQDFISIEPFVLKTFLDFHYFLKMPNDLLLEYTSTSPECEAENYCDEFRDTARFLMSTNTEDVFGPKNLRLVFGYELDSREWSGV